MANLLFNNSGNILLSGNTKLLYYVPKLGDFYSGGTIVAIDYTLKTGIVAGSYGPESVGYTQPGAISYCNDLSEAGYTDWYLPDSGTMCSIRTNWYYYPLLLSNIRSTTHWTSTVINTNNGTMIQFDDASSCVGFTRNKGLTMNCLPVRNFTFLI